jgi:hypothetical protein
MNKSTRNTLLLLAVALLSTNTAGANAHQAPKPFSAQVAATPTALGFTALPASAEVLNTAVVAFPFALKDEVKTAITNAQTLAYSTEETFTYAMPAMAEPPTLLASANYDVVLPSGTSTSVQSSKLVKTKKASLIKRLFSRLFHKKIKKPTLPRAGAD